MLELPLVQPSNYTLRAAKPKAMTDDDDYTESSKTRAKSRRELPAGAVETLKAWLLSPEHFTHPYPTPQDQAMLMQKTGIDKKQLKNWFTNARRRIWKPMLKKQLEQGKISAGVVNPPSMENPHSIQAMRVHYQQAMQDQAASGQVMPQALPTNVVCVGGLVGSIFEFVSFDVPNIAFAATLYSSR